MASPAVATLLARLPPPPQRELLPGRHDEVAGPAVAERFLGQLEPVDHSILVLVLGLGLDLGSVSYVLQLDPSIVAWRLRRTLLSGPESVAPAALESGVTQWLRNRSGDAAGDGRSGGKEGTIAARFFADFSADARERLEVRLDSHDQEASTATRRPGLGIGSLVLILVAAAGFMVYGAVRDVNPLWRGMALVRQADFNAARDSFQELGALPEGRAWIAITWLAEGDFDHALMVLAEPGATRFLGEFRPMDAPLPGVDFHPGSHALLPRGLSADPRPPFVYIADGATTLTLDLNPDEPGRARKVSRKLPGDGTATGVTVLPYPDEWPDLPEGVVLWDVQGAETEPTSVSLLPRDARREITLHATARLTHEIPLPAREFLRAQYDLRNGLLVQAAEHVATLAGLFPDAAYPRETLVRIGAALGVDPAVLVR